MLIPLKHHSAIIGHLTIAVPLESNLQPKHLTILAALLSAEITTELIKKSTKNHNIGRINAEKALLSSKEQQKSLLSYLQNMHDISFQLWRNNIMEDMLFIAVEEGKKRLNIDRMAIFLFDEQKQT